MKILKALKKVWDKEYEHGDIELIAAQSKISKTTIGHALRTGKCSRNTLDHINAYFLRKREIKKAETESMIKQFQ